MVGGVVLIAMALAIGFESLRRPAARRSRLRRRPAEQGRRLPKGPPAASGSLTGSGHSSLAKCNSTATTLIDCGPAHQLAGVTSWLNTPGGGPLSINGLRGHVVLVDFWTLLMHQLPAGPSHVEAWYNRYQKDGLVVVGVHTPEFSFEHVVSNVRSAICQASGSRIPSPWTTATTRGMRMTTVLAGGLPD